jgi:nitroimidazol reductase NimA-like FMN-containing flavoprotein (pyridoxamine 5'-phosphate oxidase superfamily)
MTVEESRSHLAPGGVGRFLYDADRGPVAVPVNYAMLGDDVIFKADKQTATAAAAAGQHKVSFDVDHIDDALDEGWSVLLSGTASVLTSPADREAAEQLGIQSWANIDGGSYVRLVPDLITGRRIRVSAAR